MNCLTLTELLASELETLNLDKADIDILTRSSLYCHDEGSLNVIIMKHDKHENLIMIYLDCVFHDRLSCSAILDYSRFNDKQSLIDFACDEIHAQAELKMLPLDEYFQTK